MVWPVCYVDGQGGFSKLAKGGRKVPDSCKKLEPHLCLSSPLQFLMKLFSKKIRTRGVAISASLRTPSGSFWSCAPILACFS